MQQSKQIRSPAPEVSRTNGELGQKVFLFFWVYYLTSFF